MYKHLPTSSSSNRSIITQIRWSHRWKFSDDENYSRHLTYVRHVSRLARSSAHKHTHTRYALPCKSPQSWLLSLCYFARQPRGNSRMRRKRRTKIPNLIWLNKSLSKMKTERQWADRRNRSDPRCMRSEIFQLLLNGLFAEFCGLWHMTFRLLSFLIFYWTDKLLSKK